MERAGLGLESPSYVQKRLVLGKQQRMLAEHCQANKLVRQSKREKAYGVGSQPRALHSDVWLVGPTKRIVLGKFGVIMQGSESSRFIDRSQIEKVHIFAGYGNKKGTELRVRDRLVKEYGGSSAQWSHAAGDGWIFDPVSGKIRQAEVHWMEEATVGMTEFYFKRWRN